MSDEQMNERRKEGTSKKEWMNEGMTEGMKEADKQRQPKMRRHTRKTYMLKWFVVYLHMSCQTPTLLGSPKLRWAKHHWDLLPNRHLQVNGYINGSQALKPYSKRLFSPTTRLHTCAPESRPILTATLSENSPCMKLTQRLPGIYDLSHMNSRQHKVNHASCSQSLNSQVDLTSSTFAHHSVHPHSPWPQLKWHGSQSAVLPTQGDTVNRRFRVLVLVPGFVFAVYTSRFPDLNLCLSSTKQSWFFG